MTDAEVGELLERLGVLRRGHFRLSSGMHSDTYLQCALALQHPRVALELGQALADRLPAEHIDVVVSPALGGVLAGFVVAAALDARFVFTERTADRSMVLRRGQHITAGERVLVVEDVVTTGGSAREAARVAEAAGATVVGLAALVDRSVALPPEQRPTSSPTSLLQVTARAWQPSDCPACARGAALDSPGSRHVVAADVPISRHE